MVTGRSLFPDWLSKYAVATYLLALVVVSVLYSTYNVPWYFMLAGVVSVVVFFVYGRRQMMEWTETQIHKSKTYERKIFWLSFWTRLLWTLLIYTIFMRMYGDTFGFEKEDAYFYDQLGRFVAGLINEGNYHIYDEVSKWSGTDDIADMGYGIYVGAIYFLTNKNILVVRLLKCILSSYTVVLMYRLARREFGESVGRITAMFCALWPNFWYYCGVHLKETEMVFLAVLFVEQADQMLRSRQFTAWKVAPVILLAAILFTFRTPLAIVAVLALLFALVMTSSKVVGWGKRIVVGGLAVLLIFTTLGTRIEDNARSLMESVERSPQNKNLEWRSTRVNGNAFAKYAGAAVFAPLIFTIPFPTMAMPYEGQKVQMLLNGGNYVKNILSFFTIFALIWLLLCGSWRDHLLPLAFMLGYLVVLVMSSFPHSERFHQPVMPFEFMFMVYGLSIVVRRFKYKRWFGYWCVLIFLATVVWNWFKLAGRGLV